MEENPPNMEKSRSRRIRECDAQGNPTVPEIRTVYTKPENPL